MILGFGTTEVEARRAIMAECMETDLSKEALDTIAKKYEDLSDSYDKLPASEVPERYTRFWVFVHEALIAKFVTLRFHHINRRHPFSPDGWAMVKVNCLIMQDYDGVRSTYEEV